LRELFLLDPTITFLNHGSYGACPRPVFEAYQQWQLELERQPVLFLGRRYHALYQDARDALANYLDATPTNIAFVPNATTGLNTIARSLDLKPQDEILTTDHEYGALDLMWQFLANRKKLTLVRQKIPLPLMGEEAVIEAFWAGVTARTRVIFLSHITSSTALILPVEKICHRARQAGILTVVDGAHAPGQIPLQLERIGADFYSGNCHKWMCAPKSSAFIYARPEHHELIHPLVISWGWDEEADFYARTAWQGTRDVSAFLTVPQAIRFLQAQQWETAQQRCHELAIHTMHRICEISGKAPLAMPRFFGQMVSAPLPDCAADELQQQLYADYRIEVPIIEHQGAVYIRVSIQIYNTREDADALIKALQEIFAQ